MGADTKEGNMIKRYIVAFSTLFSAVLILVMVLTALAQIRPGSLGEVLPDHRPQELAQADPHRSPEREVGSSGRQRSDARIDRRPERGPGDPESAAPAGETVKG